MQKTKPLWYFYYGPRAVVKQKQPWTWSSGIIPPPLLVSIASNKVTTSSMSGLLSGFASQHFRMMLAKELGQHLGISGRKFCQTQFIKIGHQHNTTNQVLRLGAPNIMNNCWVYSSQTETFSYKHIWKDRPLIHNALRHHFSYWGKKCMWCVCHVHIFHIMEN